MCDGDGFRATGIGVTAGGFRRPIRGERTSMVEADPARGFRCYAELSDGFSLAC